MSEDFLGSPYNDARWAPNKDFADQMRTFRNNASATNDATQIGPYKGRRYMAVTGRAFNEIDDYFSVSLTHSFMHSGGAPGKPKDPLWTETVVNISVKTGKELPFPREKLNIYPVHDLEYMGAKYNKIIESCTPQGKSMIGPARTRN